MCISQIDIFGYPTIHEICLIIIIRPSCKNCDNPSNPMIIKIILLSYYFLLDGTIKEIPKKILQSYLTSRIFRFGLFGPQKRIHVCPP